MPAGESGREGAVRRVLVVSRDARVRDDLRYGLPALFDVAFAEDSRDALAKMRLNPPDVAVVDLQAGNAGGYGLAVDMAADPATSDIPVIVLLEREQDSWLAKQAGAGIARTKPIGARKLADDILALTAAPESLSPKGS
jgi:twitching motility two-component system response regulator PilH